jgi:FAM192A/Fyv6, N-terminal domain
MFPRAEGSVRGIVARRSSSEHHSYNNHFNEQAMSSGFVAAGQDPSAGEGDEWDKARKELEANRKRKEEAAQQADGKSLFEVLEANKGMPCIAVESQSYMCGQG